MRPEERQAIRERVNKATPGPWFFYGREEGEYLLLMAEREGDNDIVMDVDPLKNVMTVSDGNGEFIAAAREDVPKLLDEVECLRSAIQQVIPRLNDIGLFNSVDVLQKALDGDEA